MTTATLENASALGAIASDAAALGRKYEDADIDPRRITLAVRYIMETPDVRSSFVQSVRRQILTTGRAITGPQVRGVLNYAAATVPRAPAVVTVTDPAMVAAPTATVPTWAPIPTDLVDGRYAVPVPGIGEGELRFYRVRTNRRTGRRYFDRLVGSPMSMRAVRVGPDERRAALGRIIADPGTAARTFGRKLGRCARCFAVLTDETSRERGIGPDCFANYWAA